MFIQKHGLYFVKIGASTAAIAWAAAAGAQVSGALPPDNSAQAQVAAPSTENLADIVVTAQKRSERLQDTPVAVTALSPETLTKSGVGLTAALSSLVPGLNANNGTSGFRPFIRGVGTPAVAAGNENSVSTYVDNIYLTSMNAGLLNLTSIESLEVIKGPQGTLFGRNATGGVINIRTRDPSHVFGSDMSLMIDNYETTVATAYITGGISDNLAIDFAGYYKNQGQGYGVNLTTGNDTHKQDTFAVRSKLLFTPTEDDSFTLAFDYSETKGTSIDQHLFPGTTAEWGAPDATHPLPAGAPYEYSGGPWDTVTASDSRLKSWFGGGSLTYVHDFSWATLSSLTAYRKSRVNHFWNVIPIPTNALIAGWNQPEKQFSQEVQLSSIASSPVKWIFGLYYLDASVTYDPFFIRGQSLEPIQLSYYMTQKIRSPALFGQITVPVEPLGDTNITGGLRYTVDKRSIVGRADVVLQADPSIVLSTDNATDDSKTFKVFTWRLGIDHHFTPNVMAYITYNRGFKAGSYNSIPPDGPDAKPTNPEYLDAYEVGIKNTLFQGKATLNISAFLYQYKDLQVTLFDGASAVTENAAKAEIKGLDIDFNAQVTKNLRFVLGAELMDHKFSDYKNGQALKALTLTEGGGLEASIGDLTGNRLPFASDAVVNVGLFYDVTTSIGDIDANVNLTWNDGFTFEPSEVVKSGSFEELNATLGWTLKNASTRISIFGRNITNSKIPRTLVTGANPGGYVAVEYSPPRTYGVAISHKF